MTDNGTPSEGENIATRTIVDTGSGLVLAASGVGVAGVLEKVKGMRLSQVDDEIVACDRAIFPLVQYKAHLLYAVWVTKKWTEGADDEGHPLYGSFIDYANKLTERERDEAGVGHSASFYWDTVQSLKIQVAAGIPLEEALPLSRRVLGEIRNLGTIDAVTGKITLKDEVKASPWMPLPEAAEQERTAELLRDLAIVRPREALAQLNDILGRSVLFPMSVEWFEVSAGVNGVAWDVVDEQGQVHAHIEAEILTTEGRDWITSRNGVERME